MKTQLLIINAVVWAAVWLGLLAWAAPRCQPHDPKIEIGSMLVAGCK